MLDHKAALAILPFLGLVVGCGDDGRIHTGAVNGTITVNGEPVEGLIVRFIPERKIRPAAGKTDASGRFEAQLLANQSGVPLGRSRVEFGLYKGDGATNYLAKWNEQEAENPDLDVEIFKDGLTFDYDIKYDGELPPKS